MQQKMTETEKIVGRIDKVVVIRVLLDCGILGPVPLVRGVLGVVGRLLEVPRVVVFPLAGKNWFQIHTERLNGGQGWPPGDWSSARLPVGEVSGEA